MLYESVFVWVYIGSHAWMYSFPCLTSRKKLKSTLQQTIALSHNFQETWTWNSLTSVTSYIFPARFKAFICQRKKKTAWGVLSPQPEILFVSQPPPLSPGPGFWPGRAWWTTTSSTTRLPIQIDVTNNGGSAGSAFDLCVRRVLWKRKSVWPDGGPGSLKGSFLRVWAKQHSWLNWPELITEKFFYVVNTNEYLSCFHSCLSDCCFVFSHERFACADKRTQKV